MKTNETQSRIWRQLRCYRGCPSVGDRYDIVLEELIRDEDGEPLGTASTNYDPVPAVVTAVGSHWSDQPHGQSGWWVEFEFTIPADVVADTEFA